MSLNEKEKKILGYIRDGRNTTACFADNLGIPAPIANNIAESLELGGYVRRVTYKNITRFSWLLTDKGVAALDPLDPIEARLLSTAGINMAQFKVLTYLSKTASGLAGEICKAMDLDPQEIVSNLSTLVDQRYINESGLIRRKLSITDKGTEIMKQFSDITL